MNILALSVGTRDKTLSYCIKEVHKAGGKVIATDCSRFAPALYECDNFYIVPRITEENYIATILRICKEERIDAVFSLIDPELTLLSQNVEKFLSNGVKCVLSPIEAIELAFDKMETFNFCKKNNINTISSYGSLEEFYRAKDKGEIDFPVFVKPKKGSCSNNISVVYNNSQLIELFNEYNNLMIQEYMKGQEIGCDVYVDAVSGEVIDIFTKKKLLMRAGETDKAISFKDERLFEFIKNFVKKAGYKWTIDIDVFERDGEYYLAEVNPRFGGGYPHANECGCDFFKYILNNVNGIANKPRIGHYEEGVVMMKYLDVKMMKVENENNYSI